MYNIEIVLYGKGGKETKGMGERVKVAEAAKILGMSQQGVREHMKRGLRLIKYH